MNNEVIPLITKIVLSSFGAVGILEWLKNFLKLKKKWIFSIIMPFIAIGCFCACEYLPISIIGGILTVGCVQLNYQVIIQGFTKIIEKVSNKSGDIANE